MTVTSPRSALCTYAVTGSRGAGPEGRVTTGLGSVGELWLEASSAIDATLGVARINAAPVAAPAAPCRNTRRLDASIPAASAELSAGPAGALTRVCRNERRLNFAICAPPLLRPTPVSYRPYPLEPPFFASGSQVGRLRSER